MRRGNTGRPPLYYNIYPRLCFASLFPGRIEEQQFGVDWEGPVPNESNDIYIVNVPDTPLPLNSGTLEELNSVISPLDRSSCYGIDLYERVLIFVAQKVGCTL